MWATFRLNVSKMHPEKYNEVVKIKTFKVQPFLADKGNEY